MSTKEKFPKLYVKAALLRRQTEILKKRSWLYYVFFLFMLVLPLLLFLLMNLRVSPSVTEEHVYIKYIISALYILLLIIIIDWEKRFSGKMHSQYKDVQEICGELSDMIDWTTMRKRQIYRSLPIELQEPIDNFYSYSSSFLCPFYGGKRIRNAMFVILSTETVGIFMYSLISLL